MKLFINTTDSEKVCVGLNGEIKQCTTSTHKSQKLLPFIASWLASLGKTPSNICEIEVRTSHGSYTGLRVGVSVANALGFALGIPVNGKDVKNGHVEPEY